MSFHRDFIFGVLNTNGTNLFTNKTKFYRVLCVDLRKIFAKLVFRIICQLILKLFEQKNLKHLFHSFRFVRWRELPKLHRYW